MMGGRWGRDASMTVSFHSGPVTANTVITLVETSQNTPKPGSLGCLKQTVAACLLCGSWVGLFLSKANVGVGRTVAGPLVYFKVARPSISCHLFPQAPLALGRGSCSLARCFLFLLLVGSLGMWGMGEGGSEGRRDSLLEAHCLTWGLLPS